MTFEVIIHHIQSDKYWMGYIDKDTIEQMDSYMTSVTKMISNDALHYLILRSGDGSTQCYNQHFLKKCVITYKEHNHKYAF